MRAARLGEENRKATARRMGVLTFIHPRLSSDYCLAVVWEGAARIFAACDLIGRPIGLPWRSYMRHVEEDLYRAGRTDPPRGLDDLTTLVRGVLRRHNELIRLIRLRHDRSAFGFCLALAAIWEDQARVFWLGDCRAYRIVGQRVECLTRDQNELYTAVSDAPADGLTLFAAEMSELTHRLEAFLGMADDERLKACLEAEDVRVTLDGKTALLLTSDGLYMPLLRARMDRTNHRITLEDLRVESDFAALLAEADQTPAASPEEFWRRRAEALALGALRGGYRHRHYHDDIAFILIHPADGVEACRIAEG